MRFSPALMDLWQQGGVITPTGHRAGFVGAAGAPHARVTVEPAWWLSVDGTVSTPDPTTLPYRWYQRADNSQVEVEIPGVRSIHTERSIDVDAGTANIAILNQRMDANLAGQSRWVGDPGYYNPDRTGRLADARWGARDQTWAGIIEPGALVRTYQGYGGRGKTIAQALADGNLLQTGTWLVDDVQRSVGGVMTLVCRDMAALVIDQQLYPPLVPYQRYPLQWCRYRHTTVRTPAVPVYDADVGDPALEGFVRIVRDGALTVEGTGYWVLGNDGGLFSYGTAQFYGSRGEDVDVAQMYGFAPTPSGRGYWMANEAGNVYSFGDAVYHGGLGSAPPSPIRRIRSTPTGGGYWLMASDGAVYAFGDAVYHGGTPTAGAPIVDLAPTADGGGYWMVASDGAVYTFGNATYHGGAGTTGDVIVGLAPTPTGDGYWLAAADGDVYGYGTAAPLTPNGDWATAQPALADPIVAITAMPTGRGYLLIGGDGGVFSFGDAPFWGSMPAAYQTTIKSDGTYRDFSDIVKLLLLWSGFLLYGTGADTVYGNIESTGSYSEDCLPPDMFDKKAVIDAITVVKETVGYLFFVDEEGAARFESPNWFKPGNIWQTGQRTDFIPTIDERHNLIEYGLVDTNKQVRSELIISSNDPLAGFESTVTTRYTPPFATRLRGMVKPAMWVNEYLTSRAEQELMAELVAIQYFFQQRSATASAAANPALQINDQVWVFERETGEAAVKHVRGITTDYDAGTGEYRMTLTLSHLGRYPNEWALK